MTPLFDSTYTVLPYRSTLGAPSLFRGSQFPLGPPATVRTASAGSFVVYVAAQSVAARFRSMKALNQVMAGLMCATVDVDRHQVAEVVDVVECSLHDINVALSHSAAFETCSMLLSTICTSYMLTTRWFPFALELLDRCSWDLLGTVVSLVTLTADHAEGRHIAMDRTVSIHLAVAALWDLILPPRFVFLLTVDYLVGVSDFTKICKLFLAWSEVEEVGHFLVALLTHLDN